jgi:hypothetical protein
MMKLSRITIQVDNGMSAIGVTTNLPERLECKTSRPAGGWA